MKNINAKINEIDLDNITFTAISSCDTIKILDNILEGEGELLDQDSYINAWTSCVIFISICANENVLFPTNKIIVNGTIDHIPPRGTCLIEIPIKTIITTEVCPLNCEIYLLKANPAMPLIIRKTL